MRIFPLLRQAGLCRDLPFAGEGSFNQLIRMFQHLRLKRIFRFVFAVLLFGAATWVGTYLLTAPKGKISAAGPSELKSSTRRSPEGRTEPETVVPLAPISAIVAEVKQRKDEAPPRRGVPYDSRLHVLATMNPALGLSLEDIKSLQAIYSDYCRARAEFETTIAEITAGADGSVVSKIPPYPAEARLLQTEMMKDVDQYFRGAAAQPLRDALAQAFAGDNSDLGANAQTITVKPINSPGNRNRYEVTREVTFGTPGANMSGTYTSTSQVREIEASPYAGQGKFFPRLR